MALLWLIILMLILTGIGIYGANGHHWFRDFLFPFCVAALIILSYILVIFIVHISTKGYEYRKTNQKRESIVMTIENLKQTNKFETTIIGKEILDFNIELGEKKRYRKTYLWKGFVDKRFEDMEYISIE